MLLFVIFYPLLRRSEYSLNWREALVLSWSGLRGAVGLSLALFVLLDDSIADEQFRSLSFFFMGVIAFLTVMVQGVSMPWLLQVRHKCSIVLGGEETGDFAPSTSLAPCMEDVHCFLGEANYTTQLPSLFGNFFPFLCSGWGWCVRPA